MLAPILVGGVLAILTFAGLQLFDRLHSDQYDETYEQALRERCSRHTW